MTFEKTNKKCTLVQDEEGVKRIKISFPYNFDIIMNVRTLLGRKYHKEATSWSAALVQRNVDLLKDWGFTIDTPIEDALKQIAERKTAPTLHIPSLKGKLFPYQQEGVAFVESKEGRALVADEMGLGKTVQALAWLQLHREKKPVIIVVPASLKIQWKEMTYNWLPNPKVEILSGNTVIKCKADIYIINYDILPSWVDYLLSLEPQVLITDECHYFKNNAAKRTKAVKRLGKKIPYIIGLSGTPILSRPIEIYNAWKLIDPQNCPDYWYYVRTYCNARNNGFGWDFSGASHTEQLHHELINSFMIRRLKKDVLTQLPDKIYSFVPMELDNEDEYIKAEKDFIQFIRETKGHDAAIRASNAEKMTQIQTLKQVAVRGKMESVFAWIENFLEVDGKLVVFAEHHFVLDALLERFKKVAVKIDGRTSSAGREEVKRLFREDESKRLFIGGIQATKEGIDLTVSSNVAFIEFPWTPGDLNQCSDRCHRIGQKDSVNVYYLLVQNTIEEKIARILDSKKMTLDSVLDGKVTEQTSLLTELIKSYENDNERTH
jgi:SWI/SNF-related matrix-associated actin-dependent regulator of chromatin subfamily A-like protein 1